MPFGSSLCISLGTGSGAMGRHTKRGGYFIEWEKVRAFVVPDLTGFKVRIHQFQEAIVLYGYSQIHTGSFLVKKEIGENSYRNLQLIILLVQLFHFPCSCCHMSLARPRRPLELSLPRTISARLRLLFPRSWLHNFTEHIILISHSTEHLSPNRSK